MLQPHPSLLPPGQRQLCASVTLLRACAAITGRCPVLFSALLAFLPSDCFFVKPNVFLQKLRIPATICFPALILFTSTKHYWVFGFACFTGHNAGDTTTWLFGCCLLTSASNVHTLERLTVTSCHMRISGPPRGATQPLV